MAVRKPVESSWLMSEQEAAHYKDAERIEGTLEIRKPMGSTGDRGAIAEHVHAGQYYRVRLGPLPIRATEGGHA